MLTSVVTPSSAQVLPSILTSSSGLTRGSNSSDIPAQPSRGFAGMTNSPVFSGIKIYPQEPFRFDFIVSDYQQSKLSSQRTLGPSVFQNDLTTNDTGSRVKPGMTDEKEYLKLIKYFMASLTVPEGDLWVNLSPYEPDRIVPSALGQTDMGRDMLAQDYILKQLTASLMSPEGESGKKFWENLYEKLYASGILHLGSGESNASDQMQDAVETFNKIWIVPNTVEVYQNNDVAYIVNASFKVMLESDYLAAQEHNKLSSPQVGDSHLSSSNASIEDPVSSVVKSKSNGTGSWVKTSQDDSFVKDVIRSTIIPLIEEEVNHGESFAPLRQIFHSVILAKWYKQHFKNSILGQNYADQKITPGIELAGADQQKESIYNAYVEAFKTGSSDLIKEEYDPTTQTVIPRKYFTGGVGLAYETRPSVPAEVIVNRASPGEVVSVNFAMMQGKNPEQKVIYKSFASSKVIIFDWRGTLYDYSNQRFYPDALHLLESLKKQKHQAKVYVVTGERETDWVRRVLREAGFEDLAKSVIFDDGTKEDTFKQLMSRNGVKPEEVLVIDDGAGQIGSAQRLGMKAVGIRWSGGGHRRSMAQYTDQILLDLSFLRMKWSDKRQSFSVRIPKQEQDSSRMLVLNEFDRFRYAYKKSNESWTRELMVLGKTWLDFIFHRQISEPEFREFCQKHDFEIDSIELEGAEIKEVSLKVDRESMDDYPLSFYGSDVERYLENYAKDRSPLGELINALGLKNLKIIAGRTIEKGVKVYSVEIPGIADDMNLSAAQKIFREMVAPQYWPYFQDRLVIDLLVRDHDTHLDQLMAIFPHVRNEDIEFFQSSEQSLFYYDLLPYAVSYDSIQSLSYLESAAKTLVEREDIVARYIQSRPEYRHIQTVAQKDQQRSPFFAVSVNLEQESVEVESFVLKNLLREEDSFEKSFLSAAKGDPSKRLFINFPTVPSPLDPQWFNSENNVQAIRLAKSAGNQDGYISYHGNSAASWLVPAVFYMTRKVLKYPSSSTLLMDGQVNPMAEANFKANFDKILRGYIYSGLSEEKYLVVLPSGNQAMLDSSLTPRKKVALDLWQAYQQNRSPENLLNLVYEKMDPVIIYRIMVKHNPEKYLRLTPIETPMKNILARAFPDFDLREQAEIFLQNPDAIQTQSPMLYDIFHEADQGRFSLVYEDIPGLSESEKPVVEYLRGHRDRGRCLYNDQKTISDFLRIMRTYQTLHYEPFAGNGDDAWEKAKTHPEIGFIVVDNLDHGEWNTQRRRHLAAGLPLREDLPNYVVLYADTEELMPLLPAESLDEIYAYNPYVAYLSIINHIQAMNRALKSRGRAVVYLHRNDEHYRRDLVQYMIGDGYFKSVDFADRYAEDPGYLAGKSYSAKLAFVKKDKAMMQTPSESHLSPEEVLTRQKMALRFLGHGNVDLKKMIESIQFSIRYLIVSEQLVSGTDFPAQEAWHDFLQEYEVDFSRLKDATRSNSSVIFSDLFESYIQSFDALIGAMDKFMELAVKNPKAQSHDGYQYLEAKIRQVKTLRQSLFTNFVQGTPVKQPVRMIDVIKDGIEKIHHDLTDYVMDMNEFLELDIPEDLMIDVDPDLTARAFAENLSNPFKYHQDGNLKKIKIKAYKDPDTDQVVLEILDDGQGFSEEMRDVDGSFNKALMLDVSTRVHGGLGLAFFQRVMGDQGIDVNLSNEGLDRADGKPGKGAKFIVRFPTLIKPQEGLNAEQPNYVTYAKAKVLILDWVKTLSDFPPSGFYSLSEGSRIGPNIPGSIYKYKDRLFYKGIRDILVKLSDRPKNLKIYIVSTVAKEEELQKFLKMMGLPKFYDEAIYVDPSQDGRENKMNAFGWLLARDGFAPEDAFAVGDNSRDELTAARRWGFKSLAVNSDRTTSQYSHIKDDIAKGYEGDYVLRDIGDLKIDISSDQESFVFQVPQADDDNQWALKLGLIHRYLARAENLRYGFRPEIIESKSYVLTYSQDSADIQFIFGHEKVSVEEVNALVGQYGLILKDIESNPDKGVTYIAMYIPLSLFDEVKEGKEPVTTNPAMLLDQNAAPGGIDLNNLNMQTSGQAAPIQVSDPAMMNIKINGLVPQIIHVSTMKVGQFLGLDDQSNPKSDEQVSWNDQLAVRRES